MNNNRTLPRKTAQVKARNSRTYREGAKDKEVVTEKQWERNSPRIGDAFL